MTLHWCIAVVVDVLLLWRTDVAILLWPSSDKHSGSFEELTVFILLDIGAPNTYISAQIFDEVLKKKESYKLHCQAEAMCKSDGCRPMIELYVDVDAVHHPDSAILILHRVHGYLSCCIFSLTYLVFSSKIIINYNPWFLISSLLPSSCQAYGKLLYKPYRFGWQLLLNFSCYISIDWYL